MKVNFSNMAYVRDFDDRFQKVVQELAALQAEVQEERVRMEAIMEKVKDI